MAKEIPSKQRALVLQGGGALGAYQVGVLKVLAKKIIEEDEKNAEQGRPLFDIIAGTSIGAMNAAVLVSLDIGCRTGFQSFLYTTGMDP